MNQLKSLQILIEKCLKAEGLYKLIPEDRRDVVISFSSGAVGWFFFLWFTQIYFILERTNFENWVIAIFAFPILLVISLAAMVIYLAILTFQKGKNADLSKYTQPIGSFFLLIFPLILAVGTGLYLRSLLVPIYMIVISVIGVGFYLLFFMQRYRVSLIVESAKSIFKILIKSAGKIIVLLPVLLIIVLLSIFSGELWESVGNLTASRIVGITFLIFIPTALLIYASLSTTARQIVELKLETLNLVEKLKNYPLINNELVRGLISPEEWSDGIDEYNWRSKEKIATELLPIIQRRVKHWLAIFLVLTTLIVTFSFFIYFCTFFYILLKPEVISKWVNIPNEMPFYTLRLPKDLYIFSFNNTVYPIIKVSTLLSVFIALASNVYALTDESALAKLTGWLSEKAQLWLALGYFYEGLNCPNYQIWNYKVKDKKRGIANVNISVPNNCSDEDAERACNHLKDRLIKSNRIVIVRAFQQNDITNYESLNAKKFWDLIYNSTNDSEMFTPVDYTDEEISSQHFLGLNNYENNEDIPNEWFGSNEQAVSASKIIWESDEDKIFILHPYFNYINTDVFVDIRLKKRLSESEQYRKFVENVVRTVLETSPSANNINIQITFRDTVETLASLWLLKTTNYVSYRDEIKGEGKFEKIDRWIQK